MNGLPNHVGDSALRLGVAFFGGSSPSGNTTTTQSNQPWSGQMGPLLDIYGQATDLDRNAVPQYFPGSTYQPLTPQQNYFVTSLQNSGVTGGNTGLQQSNNAVTSMLSPDYTAATAPTFSQAQGVLGNELDPGYLNPWNSPSFGTVVNNTLASTLPAVTSSFVNGGRSDSGLATRAATMAATDAVGNLAQSQYNTNQGIQNAAAGQAANNFLTQQGDQLKGIALSPGVDQQQMSDMSTALSAAGLSQTDIQNQIAAEMARYNYGQMLPWNQLSLYQQMIQGGGSPGGTSTTTQPYFNNTGANVLSAGAGLASIAASAAIVI